MPPSDNDTSPTAALAEDLGLARMSENYPGDLERAWRTAHTITQNMPRDLSPVDEPAHIFLANSRQVTE